MIQANRSVFEDFESGVLLGPHKSRRMVVEIADTDFHFLQGNISRSPAILCLDTQRVVAVMADQRFDGK